MQVIDRWHDHALSIVHLVKVHIAQHRDASLNIALDILALILLQLFPYVKIERLSRPNGKLKVAQKLPHRAILAQQELLEALGTGMVIEGFHLLSGLLLVVIHHGRAPLNYLGTTSGFI